jgi:drug/metabolite transporter (DMT)-like permease
VARVLSTSHGTHRGHFGPAEWALFLGIALIWGSSFVLIEVGLEAFTPAFVTWLRVAGGAATLFLIPRARTAVAREDLPRILLLSVSWVAIPFSLFPIAQQWITSATTGMLNGLMPLAATAITALLLRERPTGVQLTGLVLGFLGGVAIAAPSMGEGASEARGVLLVAGATLLYGFSISIATPLQQRYGSLPVMARMLGFAALWTAPLGIAGFPTAWPFGPTIATVVLGAVNTGIAYLVMGTLIARVGSTRGSFAIYLIPAVAVVLGVVFLGEAVSAWALFGVVLVIGGASLASRRDA